MAIDINKDVNLDADALEQVKGGGAVVSGKGKPNHCHLRSGCREEGLIG
jgi:hypothetical protein